MTQTLAGPHMNLGNAAQGKSPAIDVEEARELLREIQAALAGLGYPISTSEDPAHGVDGVWGPQTRDAVMLFQREMGMPAHGQLDRDTADAIIDAHADAVSAESTSPTLDDETAETAETAEAVDSVLHSRVPLSISDELGEPLE